MSTLLGPITDADLRRWQMQRYALLGDVLKVGQQHQLPPLTWRVTEYAVVGDLYGIPDGQRRRVFWAWVTALGLETANESETSSDSGSVYLRAAAPDGWRGHRGEVGVWATVTTEGDET
ncbi:hypothetical protein BJF79_03305 [Actinomadura sp. CNU-125]|uniref:hypothetical protein n=1 Tax=Actinomadura sp. CNU-125 TaxID=1904961 RepID=UPI00095E1E6E|nr:hypothetical protein [Actinomadura sp. CNU-125]OLT12940.1 hypothetical protein BJF79_03305 [Actinomadura sp. CNU-125]